MMELAEKSFGPSPNCQTILPAGFGLDDAVVELVGNQDVARLIEVRGSASCPLAETVPAKARTPMAVSKDHQAPVGFGKFLHFVIIDCSPFAYCLNQTRFTKTRRINCGKGSRKSGLRNLKVFLWSNRDFPLYSQAPLLSEGLGGGLRGGAHIPLRRLVK